MGQHFLFSGLEFEYLNSSGFIEHISAWPAGSAQLRYPAGQVVYFWVCGGQLSSGFSLRQQFVQTTLPKLEESSSTFREQVPDPAIIPGLPAAVAVAETETLIKVVVDELCELTLVSVVKTESLILSLLNSSSYLHGELPKLRWSRKEKHLDGKKRKRRLGDAWTKEKYEQRIYEFIGAHDY